jgi:asparagine synthase (glutamine-hydrolysing)
MSVVSIGSNFWDLMIAFFIDWNGRQIEQALGQRVASSLAIGLSGGGKYVVDGAVLYAAATPARTWRPARTPRGDLVVFSGFIDNRHEISSQLDHFAPDDATLYAAASGAWGKAADLKLIGQYAAVIHTPESRSVRAVRSPIMAPPLHVFSTRDVLVISTTPRAIFATDEVRPEVDEQKIADSLLLNYNEGRRSWYKGVSRVEIGKAVEFSQGSEVVDRYYRLDQLRPVRFKNDDDYVDAANALLQEAVKASLAGARRPGVLVSGGYDSQAVAATALRLHPDRPLIGFTGVPAPGWDGKIADFHMGDESPHVEALREMYPSLELVRRDAGDSFLGEEEQKALFLLSNVSPRNADNLHWIFDCYRAAKDRGCDVLLKGTFGNISFSFTGEGAMPAWFTSFQWGKLWRELSSTRRKAAIPMLFLSQVIRPLIPTKPWNTIQRLRGREDPHPLNSWCPLNPEWAREMNVFERAEELNFDIMFKYPPPSTREWRWSVIEHVWNEGGDIALTFDGLAGVTTRDPTGYRPLMEFCLSIPDDQYLRNGQHRWLAQRMLRGLVPDMVIDARQRGRQGADWHFRMGRCREALRRELERLEADPVMARRLNLPSLKSALDAWPAETPLQVDRDERAIAQRLELAVGRAVTTARFIRYVEGANR